MKITKIRLTNFRSHRDYSIEDLPQILIVTGSNAVGKSSLVEGIVWGLCGATRHTSASGTGADCLVMDGESRAVVELGIRTASGEHTVKRSIPHNLAVDDSKGGIKRSSELLEALLRPLLPSQLLFCLEPHRILSMSDNDRRKFLSLAVGLGGRTDAQKRTDLEAWLPTQGIRLETPEAQAVLAAFDAAEVKSHKDFYAARRDLNVAIATLSKQIMTNVTAPNGDMTAVDNRIQMLQRERALLDIERKLAARKGGEAPKTTVLKKPDLEKAEARVTNLKHIIHEVDRAVTMREQRVASLDSQINQVTSAAKQCPVFARECPLSKEEIAGAIDSTMRLKIKEAAVLSGERRKKGQSEEALRQAEEGLAAVRKEIDEFKDLWAARDVVTFENVRPVEEIDARMSVIETELKSLDSIKADRRFYEMNERLRTQLTEAKNRLQILETLVQAFSPAGIPTMLLSGHLPQLERLATEASRIITTGRYEITFSAVDGELDISVVSNGRRRPIGTLSTSESVWVSFVIQHVINQLIGNSILVLDEASVLDEEFLRGLESFLRRPLPYENIIICATSNEGTPFLPLLDEARRVRL